MAKSQGLSSPFGITAHQINLFVQLLSIVLRRHKTNRRAKVQSKIMRLLWSRNFLTD